jgi:hypothetical protein
LSNDDEAKRHWIDIDGEFHRTRVGTKVLIESVPSLLRILARPPPVRVPAPPPQAAQKAGKLL